MDVGYEDTRVFGRQQKEYRYLGSNVLCDDSCDRYCSHPWHIVTKRIVACGIKEEITGGSSPYTIGEEDSPV